ncbi:MAG TPA: RIP metalloprotease RseP [Xanthobacteraceae bacterium]|nr:RIP metalloprotease RseP [Xanthobacteraceae bacterium]
MHFLSSFGTFGSSFLSYAIPFLFVLTIVVFFHELGHFWVARRCGVKIDAFSIGFGPELFGFYDRHGTRWKVAAIPLGGYVRFYGDDSAASTPDQAALDQMSDEQRRVSFYYKPVPQRAAIVAAGPIANFILAILIFAGIFMFYGKQASPARVNTVFPNSAAAEAGFQKGDLVLTIAGKEIDTFTDMQRIVSINPGETLDFRIDRAGKEITLKATPKLDEHKDRFGNVIRIGRLGITGLMDPPVTVGPFAALSLGAQETWFVIDRTFSYIGGIVVGRESPDQLGGPLRIAQVSGQVASVGFAALMHLTAVLSVSIGLLNLFPVPLLDGGHLLFYAVEALRGRPLSEKAQELGFRIGLALVIMLMIFATWNDIIHLASL